MNWKGMSYRSFPICRVFAHAESCSRNDKNHIVQVHVVQFNGNIVPYSERFVFW